MVLTNTCSGNYDISISTTPSLQITQLKAQCASKAQCAISGGFLSDKCISSSITDIWIDHICVRYCPPGVCTEINFMSSNLLSMEEVHI